MSECICIDDHTESEFHNASQYLRSLHTINQIGGNLFRQSEEPPIQASALQIACLFGNVRVAREILNVARAPPGSMWHKLFRTRTCDLSKPFCTAIEGDSVELVALLLELDRKLVKTNEGPHSSRSVSSIEIFVSTQWIITYHPFSVSSRKLPENQQSCIIRAIRRFGRQRLVLLHANCETG